MTLPLPVDELLRATPRIVLALEGAATIAFALSGLLAAARKRLDVVGASFVAGLAAFGGGTLRDVLLDRRPFFWVEHVGWLWAILGLVVAGMLMLRTRHVAPTERAMLWPDAIGLGLFGASGTQLALAQGMPALVAVLMGVVTAVCGGVVRDVVCNEIPVAFHDRRPYAICAFAGGWMLIGLRALHWSPDAAMLTAAAATMALRMGALALDLKLPGWSAKAPFQSTRPPDGAG